MARKTVKQFIRDTDDALNIATGRRLPWWGKFLWNNIRPRLVGNMLQDSQVVDDPYRVLGLHSGASMRVVKAAYRALAQDTHPDRGGDPEQFKKVQEAYERICKERQEQ